MVKIALGKSVLTVRIKSNSMELQFRGMSLVMYWQQWPVQATIPTPKF